MTGVLGVLHPIIDSIRVSWPGARLCKQQLLCCACKEKNAQLCVPVVFNISGAGICQACTSIQQLPQCGESVVGDNVAVAVQQCACSRT
jgi:hypothetical protein